MNTRNVSLPLWSEALYASGAPAQSEVAAWPRAYAHRRTTPQADHYGIWFFDGSSQAWMLRLSLAGPGYKHGGALRREGSVAVLALLCREKAVAKTCEALCGLVDVMGALTSRRCAILF